MQVIVMCRDDYADHTHTFSAHTIKRKANKKKEMKWKSQNQKTGRNEGKTERDDAVQMQWNNIRKRKIKLIENYRDSHEWLNFK